MPVFDEKVCLFCGKSFTPDKGGKQNCCSKSCQKEYNRMIAAHGTPPIPELDLTMGEIANIMNLFDISYSTYRKNRAHWVSRYRNYIDPERRKRLDTVL